MGLSIAGCSIWSNRGRVQCDSDEQCTSIAGDSTNLMCIQGLCVEEQDDPTDAGTELCPSGGQRSSEQGVVGVFSATNAQIIVGARVRVCRALDFGCVDPVFDGVTNDEGKAEFNLPPDLSGYVEVEAEGFIPQLASAEPLSDLVPVNPMLEVDTPFPGEDLINIPLVTTQETALFATLLGTQYDAERGVLAGDISECFLATDLPLGVDLVGDDDQSSPWCLVSGLPSSTIDVAQDGPCGFLNAPAGVTSVRLVNRETGEVVREAAALVRPGWFTTVELE